MKIVYEIKSKEAVVWRCYDYGTEAELPEMIESCPVTELAPYAFSAHMDERLLEKGFREGRLRLWDPDSAGKVWKGGRFCFPKPEQRRGSRRLLQGQRWRRSICRRLSGKSERMLFTTAAGFGSLAFTGDCQIWGQGFLRAVMESGSWFCIWMTHRPPVSGKF